MISDLVDILGICYLECLSCRSLRDLLVKLRIRMSQVLVYTYFDDNFMYALSDYHDISVAEVGISAQSLGQIQVLMSFVIMGYVSLVVNRWFQIR